MAKRDTGIEMLICETLPDLELPVGRKTELNCNQGKESIPMFPHKVKQMHSEKFAMQNMADDLFNQYTHARSKQKSQVEQSFSSHFQISDKALIDFKCIKNKNDMSQAINNTDLAYTSDVCLFDSSTSGKSTSSSSLVKPRNRPNRLGDAVPSEVMIKRHMKLIRKKLPPMDFLDVAE